MLTLYYNPGSCSLASHAALEEAGLDYCLEKVDLSIGANEHADYRARNPWGRVPALEIDGAILTENVAILSYIADRVPERRLLPPAGSLLRVRALEWLALLSSTVHIAFRPIFRPNRLAESEEAQRDVTTLGLKSLNRTLTLVEQRLGAGPYALGDTISVCDLYLFVFALWSRRPVLIGRLDPLPLLDAFGDRLATRPSVQAALAGEGLNWPPRIQQTDAPR